MSNVSGRLGNSELPESKSREQWGAEGDAVPAVPGWVRNGGFLFLTVMALTALAAMAEIGHVYGVGYGWALLVIAICGTGSLWWQGYSRRVEEAEVRNEQALYVLHEIAKIDAMAWRRFEHYCADLLRSLGYRDVVVIGSTPGENGVDIVATAPDGTLVAVQCKHRKSRKGTVEPEVIRGLAGAISAGRHQGRTGIVMTNARATGGAHARAKEHGIALVDRLELQMLMSLARAQTEERGRAPGTPGSARSRGMRPAEKATAGILVAGFVLLMVIALHQSAARIPAKETTPRPHPAVSGPSAVVMAAFTAINRHDWPTLCRLWSHHGPCRGSGYRKMIAGYKLTARDVVTRLRTHGDAVSGRLLAYETTGAVQTYAFGYKIKNGEITWSHSALMKTSYPWHKAPSTLAHPPSLTAFNAR